MVRVRDGTQKNPETKVPSPPKQKHIMFWIVTNCGYYTTEYTEMEELFYRLCCLERGGTSGNYSTKVIPAVLEIVRIFNLLNNNWRNLLWIV